MGKLDPGTRRQLERFIKKVDILDQSGFMSILKEQGLRARLSYEKNVLTKREMVGPSRDDISAFVLTYRFFCQNNEATSLSRMDALFSNLPSGSSATKRFSQLRADVNAFLDRATPIVDQGKRVTHREIIEVFVYGHYAHSNDSKEAQYERWEKEDRFPSFWFEFVSGLSDFLSYLREMRELCQDVLDESGL